MFKKKITKLLMTLFLSSSILSVIGCNNPSVDDQIVDEDNVDTWNETLSKLQSDVLGSDFFEGFTVQNTLKYVKKERKINDSVFINAEKEVTKSLTSGNNIIKSEIRWKKKKESVDIKIVNVPNYENFLKKKATTNFNLTTEHTYQNIIDKLKEDINREEVLISFSDIPDALNAKLPAGEKNYDIKFSYNNNESNFEHKETIKVETIKTDKDSLQEIIGKVNWKIEKFTTNNTYQEVLDNIRKKIDHLPKVIDSTLQNDKIEIIFENNLQLKDFLPKDISKIKVKLKYNTSIEEATIYLSGFTTSALDLEINKVENEILHFTTEHTYQDVLDEIKSKIDSEAGVDVKIEVNGIILDDQLGEKLPSGTNEIRVNFEFDEIKKSKSVKIMDVNGPATILTGEVINIEKIFKEKLTWNSGQTNQNIYNKIISLLKNKKITINILRDENIEEVLLEQITLLTEIRIFQLKLCTQTVDLRLFINSSK